MRTGGLRSIKARGNGVDSYSVGPKSYSSLSPSASLPLDASCACRSCVSMSSWSNFALFFRCCRTRRRWSRDWAVERRRVTEGVLGGSASKNQNGFGVVSSLAHDAAFFFEWDLFGVAGVGISPTLRVLAALAALAGGTTAPALFRDDLRVPVTRLRSTTQRFTWNGSELISR